MNLGKNLIFLNVAGCFDLLLNETNVIVLEIPGLERRISWYVWLAVAFRSLESSFARLTVHGRDSEWLSAGTTFWPKPPPPVVLYPLSHAWKM
jgi:hypothetical protein